MAAERDASPEALDRAGLRSYDDPDASSRLPLGNERLGSALRRLVEQATGVVLTEAEAHEAAAELEAIADRFANHPHRGPKPVKFPDLGNLQETFSVDPIIGRSNPIAPPVEIEVDGEVVRGRVRLGAQYEGPPGFVHGAIVAAVFDQVLGLANIAGGNAGMTGTLTVRYRSPTPLHTDLSLEARVTTATGRKSTVRGALRAGETVCAEAEGIFIGLTRETGARYFRGGA